MMQILISIFVYLAQSGRFRFKVKHALKKSGTKSRSNTLERVAYSKTVTKNVLLIDLDNNTSVLKNSNEFEIIQSITAKKRLAYKNQFYSGYGIGFYKTFSQIFEKQIVEEAASDFLAFSKIPNA